MSTILTLLMGAFLVPAYADSTQCTREWAKDKIENQSFKVIGLGLSTKPDPREAADEAKAEAIKDILLQLKTNVESKSTVEKTSSDSKFNSESILSAKLDDLKGLKPVKSGSNPAENIRDCEVYEFNVQAAYDEMRGKISPLIDRLQSAVEGSAEGFDLIKTYPSLKSSVDEKRAELRRADAFKTVLGRPGPGWEEQADKQLNAMEDALKKMKDKIWFVLPEGKFDTAFAEVESRLSNNGVHVAHDAKDVSEDGFPVLVNIKEIGSPRKTQSSLGLTITRKVAVSLVHMKTKKNLGSNRGINVVGTSASNDADAAMANSDAQVTAAIMDAIRAFMPQLAGN